MGMGCRHQQYNLGTFDIWGEKIRKPSDIDLQLINFTVQGSKYSMRHLPPLVGAIDSISASDATIVE